MRSFSFISSPPIDNTKAESRWTDTKEEKQFCLLTKIISSSNIKDYGTLKFPSEDLGVAFLPSPALIRAKRQWTIPLHHISEATWNANTGTTTTERKTVQKPWSCLDELTLWRLRPTCKQGTRLTSAQFSRPATSNSLWPHGLQHARPPCPSPISGARSNSCPLSQRCHPTISPSVIPFSSWLQSFLASGSFPKSQLFIAGGQSIGASASASVLPMNIQDWFPLRLTCLISLQSMGHSREFSNTADQKHQFFGTQLSLWSNSHIHTWLLEKL